MRIVRDPLALRPRRRATALGTFDGVHLGHQRVLTAAVASGLTATVITFDPHPRAVLGGEVDLLATLERRLELLAAAGLDEALVLAFTQELAELEAEEFAETILRPVGTEIVVAGEGFRFGRGRAGDLALLGRMGFDARPVPLLEGVSSTAIRQLLRGGEVDRAAGLLGRPVEVEGIVSPGDRRGATLGFPTANLAVPPSLLVPAAGIYAGATQGHRAAISIGTNPHYGGSELRVEAHLLEFAGDLYGQRLVVELWHRLRGEARFASEAELVEQIARDVEATRAAEPPLRR